MNLNVPVLVKAGEKVELDWYRGKGYSEKIGRPGSRPNRFCKVTSIKLD